MAYADRLRARSAAIASRLETGVPGIALAWVALASIGSVVRLLLTPSGHATAIGSIARTVPYVLVVVAPVVTLLLAERYFRGGGDSGVGMWRRVRTRRWRDADATELSATAYYGVGGILVSLLIGVLLNVPMRLAEFLVAIPVLGPAAPGWFHVLYRWMLFDTLVLTSCYALVFVAGLRRISAFPMLLVLTWTIDLSMQLAIGLSVANAGPLPHDVSAALVTLLTGNIQKVAISVAIWMPYLILSRRVGATYLGRVAV